MLLVITMVLIVALVLQRRNERANGPHLMRMPDQQPNRILLVNVRELTATVLSKAQKPIAQYDLRRSTDGSWEQRETDLPPPEAPLLFPTHPLRPPRETSLSRNGRDNDDAAGLGPDDETPPAEWLPCAESAERMIEQAYQRYENG
jgi:hypothetical protein